MKVGVLNRVSEQPASYRRERLKEQPLKGRRSRLKQYTSLQSYYDHSTDSVQYNTIMAFNPVTIVLYRFGTESVLDLVLACAATVTLTATRY